MTVDPSDFCDVEIALVEGRTAAVIALSAGLPHTAQLRTAAPDLLMGEFDGAQVVDDGVTPDDVLDLDAATLPFSLDLYNACNETDELKDYGLIAARTVLGYQTLMLRAMTLKEEDFSRSLAVVNLKMDDDELDQMYNPPWQRLLAQHPRLRVHSSAPKELAGKTAGDHVNANLLTRLRYEFGPGVAYRFLLKAFDKLGVTGPSGSILMQSDNGLLKEIAFHLVGRGLTLQTLPTPQPIDNTISTDLRDQLNERFQPVVHKHIEGRLAVPVVAPMQEIFMERFWTAVAQYRGMLPAWRKAISAKQAKRPRAVMGNYPLRPESVALYRVCKEMGIPLITAQHGVSREINGRLQNARAYYENNSSHLFLTYNDATANIANNENEFARGRAVSIGMPTSFLRSGNYRKPKSGGPPILYASTHLYIGNRQMVQGGGPDLAKATFEIEVLEKVFNQLPHQVLYKPYPSRSDRYFDADPVRLRVEELRNLVVYPHSDDMRYLLPDSRVLIASRGMSTVGFCLISGKPLVYIDIPKQVPLRKNVRKLLEDAAFVFDGGSQTFHEDMKTFLSQPLERIEALWLEKAAARQQFIADHIETGGPGAGRRGADHIMQYLKGNS
jgi:hypothetical protein